MCISRAWTRSLGQHGISQAPHCGSPSLTVFNTSGLRPASSSLGKVLHGGIIHHCFISTGFFRVQTRKLDCGPSEQIKNPHQTLQPDAGQGSNLKEANNKKFPKTIVWEHLLCSTDPTLQMDSHEEAFNVFMFPSYFLLPPKKISKYPLSNSYFRIFALLLPSLHSSCTP